jgi:hypothetical protein
MEEGRDIGLSEPPHRAAYEPRAIGTFENYKVRSFFCCFVVPVENWSFTHFFRRRKYGGMPAQYGVPAQQRFQHGVHDNEAPSPRAMNKNKTKHERGAGWRQKNRN